MAENSESDGYPVQIVKKNENGEFELVEEALNEILLHESVCDTPTVVVSIAGAFREGNILFKLLLFLKKSKNFSLTFIQENLSC